MDEKEGQGSPQKEILKKKEKQNYYQYLAHQIEREDGLVNTRLNWMLTTQGLFFAALALLADMNRILVQRVVLAHRDMLPESAATKF